jgi:hypothetical protein
VEKDRSADEAWRWQGNAEAMLAGLIKEARALLLLPSSSLCRGWGWNGMERNGDGRNTWRRFGIAFFKKTPPIYSERAAEARPS